MPQCNNLPEAKEGLKGQAYVCLSTHSAYALVVLRTTALKP
jgi:hypothetical protein